MIEVNLNGNRRFIGLIVDTVAEVRNIRESEMEAPGADAQAEGDLLMGLGKANDKVILIIDIEKIVNQGDAVILKKDLAEQDEAMPAH